MRKKVFLSLAIVVTLVVGGVAGGLLNGVILGEPGGSVPTLINYQGTLLNQSTGDPVPDGQYSIVFSIHSNSTGGSHLWQETQSATVHDGLFSVMLGNVTPLAASLFDGSPRYLGIKVEADAEMTPRQLLASVPYAFHAENASTLDGMGSDDFVNVAGDNMTGRLNVQGTDIGVYGNGSTYGVYGKYDADTYGYLGSSSRGVYGQYDANNYGWLGSYDIGVYGNSINNIGVYGDGYCGVYGNGSTYGVYGDGDTYGVYGKYDADTYGWLGGQHSGADTGVYGTGYFGVYGDGYYYGVYGNSSWTGVKGNGDTYGVYGSGGSYGVYGYSPNSIGVYGNSINNIGVYGKSYNASSYDFYAGGSGTDYGPFTGAHEVKLSAGFPQDIQPGMVVSVTGETQMRMAGREISYSSTLPTVQLSDTPNDSRVFGVLIAEAPLPDDHWYINESGEDDRFGIVNALGEGRVWVTSVNGDIQAGDYITTSLVAGYGQKQDDDLLHSYTLGKAIEDVDWSEVTETVELNGNTYKAYPIAVVYTSG